MAETIDLINALASSKTADANKIFNDVMASKLNAALNSKKIEVANDVYNGVSKNLEQETTDHEVQGT